MDVRVEDSQGKGDRVEGAELSRCGLLEK
jgi:hypothetical protein